LQHNEIGLHSFGNEGLEELKNKIDDLDKVFIGFYHEEYERDPGYVIINYIPPSTSGVKRGTYFPITSINTAHDH
jgi:hypothetical protein